MNGTIVISGNLIRHLHVPLSFDINTTWLDFVTRYTEPSYQTTNMTEAILFINYIASMCQMVDI